jgi:hypothetical protein
MDCGYRQNYRVAEQDRDNGLFYRKNFSTAGLTVLLLNTCLWISLSTLSENISIIGTSSRFAHRYKITTDEPAQGTTYHFNKAHIKNI